MDHADPMVFLTCVSQNLPGPLLVIHGIKSKDCASLHTESPSRALTHVHTRSL